MKKKNLFIAVMALALTAVGCSKTDAPTDNTNDLTITFQMGDKGGFDTPTKALKTGWADGDYVSIVFTPQGATQCLGYSTAEVKAPRVILLEWDEDTNRWNVHVDLFTTEGGNLSSLGTTGTYYAVHHRGVVYFHTDISAGLGDNCYTLTGYKGGELLYATGTYAYSDSNLDLGFINMTLDPRLFQVSVPEEIWEKTEANIWLKEMMVDDGGGNKTSSENSRYQESITLSIYKNWVWSNEVPTPTTTLSGIVALQEGAVTMNFSNEDEEIFVYNTGDLYKKNSTPVMNPIDEFEEDFSFCFANTSTGKVIAPISYTFYIERSIPAGVDGTIQEGLEELYRTVPHSDNQKIEKGKAYKLANRDMSDNINYWTAN